MCVGLAPHDAADERRRRRRRQRGGAARRADRPRRDRRRLGAGQRRARRGRRGQAPDRPDRRPVRREEADGVLPRAARPRPARLAPGPRRRRPDLVGVGDGEQGRGRARHRRRARCRCASPTWSRSRSWSPSRRSGCCASSSPSASADVLAVCERWETLATPIGAGDRRAAASAILERRRGGRRAAGAAAGRRLPAVRPRAGAAGGAAVRRRRAAVAAGRDPADDRCSRCWRAPTSPRVGRSSSSTTRSCSRVRCAAPSRRTRPCCAAGAAAARPSGDPAIAISIDGNGRRVACDPRAGAAEVVYECAANLACVGAEPLGLTNCLNFGNPEKPHVAWQLTRGGRGARARRARRSACRSSAATSRSTTSRPTGRSCRRRSSGWSASCPTRAAPAGSGSRDAGDAIALVGSFNPSRAGSEIAKLQGERARWAHCPLKDVPAIRDAQASGPAGRAVAGARRMRMTSPRAGSRWRWPSAASPAASARASGCRTGSIRSARTSGPRSSSPARREALAGPAS